MAEFRYDPSQIDSILGSLSAFSFDRDALLEEVQNLARWALMHERMERDRPYAGAVSAELKSIAGTLRQLQPKIAEISGEASGQLSDFMFYLEPDGYPVVTVPDVIRGIGRLTAAALAAADEPVPGLQAAGRPSRHAPLVFASWLAAVFHRYTGKLPTRKVDHLEDRDPEGGPFYHFAVAAIVPTGLAENPARCIRDGLAAYRDTLDESQE